MCFNMQNDRQSPHFRFTVLSFVFQVAVALGALSSAQAQVTSPIQQTLSGAAGSWQFVPLDIPAGTTSLNVNISGGIGDADLYVRAGEQPNQNDFACRPWLDGNEEVCELPTPQAGLWQLGVNGWTDFSNVTITAAWTVPEAPAMMPPPAADPGAGELTTWQKEMLDAHNVLRAQHCSPEMTWDAEVAQSAQAWADRCQWEHAQGTGLGENLAAAAGSVRTPKQTTDGWYSEIAQYNFAAPGFSFGTGHFTQVVWKGSTRLGCAMAICPATSISPDWGAWPTAQFVVCRYAPQGNTGAYAENVLPVAEGGVCD